MKKKKIITIELSFYSELEFIDLVEIVRYPSKSKKHKEKQEHAFNEIEKRMSEQIKRISYRFRIPGHNVQDIYQEALFALRFKAIKDYDKDRGTNGEPYPFDRFAALCIRRHLSTKLKSSYQNKKKVLNSSVSLDQDRNDSSDETLMLSDILPYTEETILELIEKNEYFKILFTKLVGKLSKFEQQVFALYVQKYSYEQIAEKINSLGEEVNVKSIDNALSRIKHKAREVFEKHGS